MSFAKQSMQDFGQDFASDRRGTIAIIFALSLTMVVGLVGGAVDYARWLSARDHTTAAIDAAVLAGGRALQLGASDLDAIAAATSYYNQNKASGLSANSVLFTVENGRTVVKAVSNSAIATPILSVMGIPSLPIKGTASAIIAAGANTGSHVEISLMLDTTGSMDWESSAGGKKMDYLKTAAKDLIDIVVWADQSQYKSRVALAPFATHVKVPNALDNLITNNGNRRCVRERTNSNRYTDEVPSSSNGWFTYKSNNTCGSTIVPLTSDKTALKDAIDALPTDGGTAGHLGTAWSWYLLSPKWNTIWPTDSQPMAYTLMTQQNADGQPLLRKIAVLMTDGEYNTYYNGDNSTTQARAICASMKAAGVEVYAVGFEIVAGGEADTTMSGCASSATHYYNATDGAALQTAFRDIALRISTLRIQE